MTFQKNQKIAVVIALVVVSIFFLGGILLTMFSNNASQPNSPSDNQGAAREGVPSLEIETLQKGEGAQAAAGSIVTVEYTGMFEDGTVFDSSAQYGQPLTFQLGAGEVIPGWDIGLQGMHEGGKRRLVIPPGLAYGAQGRGPIPPNTTLVFEVELIEVRTPNE